MIFEFFLYLFYGLAFFTLGIAVYAKDIRVSNLKIAKVLWLLALFGMLHGMHEWVELYHGLIADTLSEQAEFIFFIYRLCIVSISFLFLLLFGIQLNLLSLPVMERYFTSKQSVVILFFVVGCVFIAIVYISFMNQTDIYVRNLVAFPAAVLSGTGLIFFSRTVQHLSKPGANSFIGAGIFMVAYGVLAGLIPSGESTSDIFSNVIFYRGISALGIMFFTVRGLIIFDVEQLQIIKENLNRFSQSEKLTSIGRLAAGIAHEINNPLANASLNAEMLRDMVPDNMNAMKKVESIERNIERASKIAQELLQYSRETEADGFQLISLNDVVESTRSLLEHQQYHCAIEYKKRDLPDIYGIFWKLEEVLINIIMNAVDASSENGRVVVETMAEDGLVIIKVTDTGIGISKKNLSKVFDPFFTTKEVGKGTGLGLSVCYTIVHQHQGQILIDSEEGSGTTVTVSFPKGEVG